MEWNRYLRYKPLNTWKNSSKQAVINQTKESPWRMAYHIQPESGLLNDPNGFSYFNHEWHLFYQNFPMGAVHGLKCWYHLSSKDLVHWENKGLTLIPSTPYDSHGCFSGSAIPVEDSLFMMYTGNVRGEDWHRCSFQLGAWMDKEHNVKKIKTPLIKKPEEYTAHFRDPQVISHEGDYYAYLGAQNEENQGQILSYKSTDLINWEFIGPLQFMEQQQLGFMIECPNIVWVDDYPVLIFCPQGLSQEMLAYKNIYPNTYLVGNNFDAELNIFDTNKPLLQVDEGFDVYATQAFNSPDGRALAVSWIGLPELQYPSDKYGWANCLSLIKELHIQEGHLYLSPVKEIEQLRREHVSSEGCLNQQQQMLLNRSETAYEMDITLRGNGEASLQIASDESHSLNILFDFESQEFILDRTNAGIPFAEKYGTTRKAYIPYREFLRLRIFMDVSTVEIYINEGYKVFTCRIFPYHQYTSLFLKTNQKVFYNYDYWNLQSTNN